MSSSEDRSQSPKISPTPSLNNQSITTSRVIGPVRHAHYMGLSGAALRTAIGLTAGLSFLAFGYGQGKALVALPIQGQ